MNPNGHPYQGETERSLSMSQEAREGAIREAHVAFRGDVGLRVIKGEAKSVTLEGGRGRPLSLARAIPYITPERDQHPEVRDFRERNFRKVFGDLARVRSGLWLARKLGVPTFHSRLWLTKVLASGERLDLGLVGVRVVTDVGVNFLTDAFQNLAEPELMNFHGFGTGGDLAVEAATDTALQTELTTQYATDNTRPTGVQGEGASPNIYQTVGTTTPDAAVALDEHGIFDQASNAGGTLWDRTVFADVNLDGAGDSLEATYELTSNSGG